MLYHQFPDLQWLKAQVERNFSDRKGWEGRTLPAKGWPTVILNVDIHNVCRDNIRGPLSIFTNLHGESQVEIHGKRAKIKDDLFFVTNHDQHYTLEVGKANAQTFNIHFGEFFTEQVFDAISRKPESLLEQDRFITPIEKINFYNKLHYKSQDFNKLVQEILSCKDNPMAVEEKLYDLIVLLLKDHLSINKSSHQLPVIKSATRDEIMKRMLLATDFIHENLHKDLSLDELSSMACLSKFHFLRLFKMQFGKTPHQFATELKTNRAKALLKNSKEDVRQISHALGFKDPSTFSRMFYNTVGVYPSQFRDA